jgi:hypothetical protein
MSLSLSLSLSILSMPMVWLMVRRLIDRVTQNLEAAETSQKIVDGTYMRHSPTFVYVRRVCACVHAHSHSCVADT